MDRTNTDRIITVIAIAMVAIVLVGEVIVYTSDYTDYSADASIYEDGRAHYTVSASGSKNYTAISIDNGSHDVVDCVYVYYDERYASCYETVNVSIGARELDEKYYVEQIQPTLRYRNIDNVIIVNASELTDRLNEDIMNRNVHTGLICLSGALPDTVYTGSSDDLIFRWLSEGGSLYWIGNMIGKYVSTQTGLSVVDGYQELIFGSECLYEGDKPVAYDEVKTNGFTGSLSLVSNNVRYGINCALLPSDRPSLGIGFESEGYSSITFVSFGKGMICVIGGDYSNNQRYDLAQIISSGIGPSSSIVEVRTGSVTRETTAGYIDIAGTNPYVFIYLGGYYPVYCRAISL